MLHLYCDHCGDIAFESESGIAYEDDGEACMTCGYPGHVEIEENIIDAGTVEGIAYWSSSQDFDSRCKDAHCVDCNPEP